MKNIYRLLQLSFLILIFTVFGGCSYLTGEAIEIPTPSHTTINNITPEEANDMAMLSAYFTQFIDVRTPLEYAGGHIDTAININFNAPDFKEKINELDKNTRYIVYCQSGGRSAAASKVMAELGFISIYNMTGGFSAWVAAGLLVNQ
jgi:rhodanese-related sulfurtransferase